MSKQTRQRHDENQPEVNNLNETVSVSEETPETEAVKDKETEPEFTKEVVVSGAEFWKFSPEKDGDDYDGKVFRGYYRGEMKREKDGKDAATDPSQKAGAVIGYMFEQYKSKLNFLISNSHAIEKSMKEKGFSKDLLWEIEFLGKGQTAANKPYNRFECSVLKLKTQNS